MAVTLITVTTGTGGLAAAVTTAGLCMSVGSGGVPEPALIAILVAAVVVLAIGFVSNFEHQSRLWADQMEAELQARRHGLQPSRAVPAPSLPVRSSQS
ncbi:hypothetical protein [Kocuria sp. CPCC 205263]|uniref:hypothetical protein n=1 Tax=Kocuria sp. CPCC 205263 TaxID=3073555 RepID=UPI0034D6BAAD